MYFNERDVDPRFYHNSRVSSASSQEIPPYSYSGATYSPPAKVYGNRKGKWTTEEENYTNKVIWCFNAGTLPIAPDEVHVTLRSYLAEKLDCDPMRITKKYTGASCLGKKVYRIARSDDVSPEQLVQDQMELQMLEKAFQAKLDQIRSKKMLQGMSSEARRSHKEAFSSGMESMIRQSLLDNFSSSSSYTGSSPQRSAGGGHSAPKLNSPTNQHYSLPPSLLQVTNDHYMEQLKNDAAANAALNGCNDSSLPLGRIPSLNSELLFDTFGGPGSAFSSMGNLSCLFAPTTPTPRETSQSSAHLQPQSPPSSTQHLQHQSQGTPSTSVQQQFSQNSSPYKHKYNWIQRSNASLSNGSSPDNASTSGAGAPSSSASGAYFPFATTINVAAGASTVASSVERRPEESDSPSRASHSMSPGGVINDEGHLPAQLLEHRQQLLNPDQHADSCLPEAYRSSSLAVGVGSPTTSYDDNTVSSTGSGEGNNKNKRKSGLASGSSSTSSSDSTLDDSNGRTDVRAGGKFEGTVNVHAAAVEASNPGTESGQPSPAGFKRRKMSEDMTAAASSLLGFFSQFHNGHRLEGNSNNVNSNGIRGSSGLSQGSNL